jgi:Predicted dehydrogenases and related proteins
LALRARQSVRRGQKRLLPRRTHIPKRWDENGKPYKADVDDAAYATFQLAGGVIAHINSSWCTRVRRDDLVTFHVDGTLGLGGRRPAEMLEPGAGEHAAAGVEPGRAAADQILRDLERGAGRNYDNGFKAEWEMFIRHLFEGAPFKWTLVEGAKGVQLAEAGLKSWKERRWIDIPPLKV